MWTDRRGERVREGVEIVVLGPPNAGKSSLVNAIARRDVAIVTAEPGTTRDMIEVRVDLDGYAATLVDTAGLREAEGVVEREGVRRAEARAATGGYGAVAAAMRGKAPASPLPSAGRCCGSATKIDLIDSAAERARRSCGFRSWRLVGDAAKAWRRCWPGWGDGWPRSWAAAKPVVATRARHRAALRACAESIAAALGDDGRGLELRAEDLRRAGDALGRVTGRIGVEDMLDVVFRDFCIGK